jgi:hypothetical protein
MCLWEPHGTFKVAYKKDEANSTVTRADYNLLKEIVTISHLYTFLASYSTAFVSQMLSN